MPHGSNKRQKRILVIIIMAVLVSSVVAGAMSLFNRSSQTAANNNTNNRILLLNTRINYLVDFCMKSLPNGTSACDNQLGRVINKICSDLQQSLDVCHDQKVAQYYKIRNDEIMKKGPISRNDSNTKK
jgi:hypothetical protein